MCGIAGIVDGEHRTKYRNQQAVEAMLHTMKRRGPDQQHIYTDEAVTLLHARLSVMDLQHGRQDVYKRQPFVHAFLAESLQCK